LNRLAINAPSRWRIASIASDDALILPHARIRKDGIFGNDRAWFDPASRIRNGVWRDDQSLIHAVSGDDLSEHGQPSYVRRLRNSCVYRKFDSGWTQGTDWVSLQPDDGFVQADSPRPGITPQIES
jgi:hypothetical protein